MSDRPTSNPKIRIRGLSKAFGDKTVLDGIDLDVAAGTSMLSTPIPARPITFSRLAAASTSLSALVAERTARPS